MAMEDPQQPPRLSEQLAEQIEEELVTGAFPPGTRLDEMELAARFGVSRTPIREALIQMASAGMVEQRPRRGAIVPEVGANRLVEMFEVLAELESMAGRLAARRITPREQAALMAAHLACQQALEGNSSDDYSRLNDRFHHLIYAASHNDFLAAQATALRRRLQPYRRLQHRIRGRRKVSSDEHVGIVEAIDAGDGELAAERLRGHVLVHGERFADLVALLSGLKAGASARGPAAASA